MQSFYGSLKGLVKNAVLYHGPKEGWLEARRRAGVGASEVPALLGESRFSSPAKLYATKLFGDDEPMSDHAKWGLRLEPLIIEAAEEELGIQAYHNDNHTILGSLTGEPFFCTPDGLCMWEERDGVGLVQAKDSFGWDEEIPQEVWIQEQAEMAVTGLEWSLVLGLMHRKLVWKVVERDELFIRESIDPAVMDFWRLVLLADGLPDEYIDGSGATKKALARLFPEPTPEKYVELGGDFQELHLERVELKKQTRVWDERIKEIENKLRNKIGAATYGKLPNGGVYSIKLVQVPAETKLREAHSHRRIHFKKGDGNGSGSSQI